MNSLRMESPRNGASGCLAALALAVCGAIFLAMPAHAQGSAKVWCDAPIIVVGVAGPLPDPDADLLLWIPQIKRSEMMGMEVEVHHVIKGPADMEKLRVRIDLSKALEEDDHFLVPVFGRRYVFFLKPDKKPGRLCNAHGRIFTLEADDLPSLPEKSEALPFLETLRRIGRANLVDKKGDIHGEWILLLDHIYDEKEDLSFYLDTAKDPRAPLRLRQNMALHLLSEHPKGKGLYPVFWEILREGTVTGASAFTQKILADHLKDIAEREGMTETMVTEWLKSDVPALEEHALKVIATSKDRRWARSSLPDMLRRRRERIAADRHIQFRIVETLRALYGEPPLKASEFEKDADRYSDSAMSYWTRDGYPKEESVKKEGP